VQWMSPIRLQEVPQEGYLEESRRSRATADSLNGSLADDAQPKERCSAPWPDEGTKVRFWEINPVLRQLTLWNISTLTPGTSGMQFT